MNRKTLFLDTNIIIQIFEKDDIFKKSRIIKFIESNNAVLLLSLENLVEISRSFSLEQSLRLIKQIEELRPNWARSMVDLQALELNDYIRREYLNLNIEQLSPFLEDFCDLFPNYENKINPSQFVSAAFNSNENLLLREREKNGVNDLTELAKAKKEKLFTSKMNEQVFQEVIKIRLKREVLKTSKIHDIDITKIIQFCWESKGRRTLDACPSLKTEKFLSEFRSSDISRNPRNSDAMDLTMSCAIFPYVDYFATDDGYLKEGLKFVKSKCSEIQVEVIDFL